MIAVSSYMENEPIYAGKLEIIRRMFLETADKNYILARAAYFMRSERDFYWLSLHAIEKYLKAILLINGKPAKAYGHNLRVLQNTIFMCERKFDLGNYVVPDDGTPNNFTGPLEAYLVFFLNEDGDPDNRYALSGVGIGPTDLYVIDQIVWSVRRFCRPFFGQYDQITKIKLSSESRTMFGDLPIEKLLRMPVSDPQRQGFTYLNYAFAPQEKWEAWRWRYDSISSPIEINLDLLTGKYGGEKQKTAAKVLSWGLENIQIPKMMRIKINDALNAYQGNPI